MQQDDRSGHDKEPHEPHLANSLLKQTKHGRWKCRQSNSCLCQKCGAMDPSIQPVHNLYQIVFPYFLR
jgi:hypothetical protein